MYYGVFFLPPRLSALVFVAIAAFLVLVSPEAKADQVPVVLNAQLSAKKQSIVSDSGSSTIAGLSFPAFTLVQTSSVPIALNSLWAVNIDDTADLEWVQSDSDSMHRHQLSIEPGLNESAPRTTIALGDHRVAANGRKIAAAWADFDRDGDLDFALPVIDNGEIVPRQFRNDGARRFVELQVSDPFTNVPPGTVAWGDADNDGDLDLLVPSSDSEVGAGSNRLYINSGDGVLADTSLPLPPLSGASCSWADYDNDGRLDFLLCGTNVDAGVQSCVLFHNEGNLVFSSVEAGFPALRGNSTWADLDNDGDLDLFLRGIDSAGALRQFVLNNAGSGRFNPLLLPNGWGSGMWGDFDNDGFPDLLAASGWNFVFRNTGTNSFDPAIFSFQNALPQNALWVDGDGDGTLDVLTRRYAGFSYVAALYRNNSIRTNPIPSAPENLQATVSQKNVLLQWNSTVDANQRAGHSYNVRVGTAPGARDIVSPHANLNNGKLLLNELGNASIRRTFLLERLPPGKYYWAVQAIDHCMRLPGLVRSRRSRSNPRRSCGLLTSTTPAAKSV